MRCLFYLIFIGGVLAVGLAADLDLLSLRNLALNVGMVAACLSAVEMGRLDGK